MVVIIVVGMPGSGKDVFLQCAKAMGFGHVGMGDTVRRYAAINGLDSSDATIGGYAGSERQAHGPAIWAQRTLERMPTGNTVIDGSRSLEEIAFFRKELGADLRVIAITVPREIRFKRLQQRHREDDPQKLDDLVRRDSREMSWGLGKAIESADIAIDNDRGLDEFRVKCKTVLENILIIDGKSI